MPVSTPSSGVAPPQVPSAPLAPGHAFTASQISGSVPPTVHELPEKFVNVAAAWLPPSTRPVRSWRLEPDAVVVESHDGPAAQPLLAEIAGPVRQQPDGNEPAVVVPLIVERKRPSENTMSP